MPVGQDVELLRLRPHHIFCERFLSAEFPERGEEFGQMEHAIRETLISGVDTVLEVIEGPDLLCQACPLCQDDRCQSSGGNEEEVRKWDAKILKGLGMAYREKKTVQELRALIKQKAPLVFCQTKCPRRESCRVFDID